MRTAIIENYKAPFVWPKYVSVNGTEIRLQKILDETRAIYFRDSGNWDITVIREFTKKRSKLTTEHQYSNLNGLRARPITKKVWRLGNQGVL